MNTILVVEDDPGLALTLQKLLSNGGYHVVCVATGAEATRAIDQCKPDLIILDLVLPDADGLLLTSTLKAMSSAPIIICSARNRQIDRVLGLKLGASDFVAKPFDVEEVEARIEAIMRRVRGSRPATAATELCVGDLKIALSRAMVKLTDQRLHLTPTEYRLLTTLASAPDAVFDRASLARRVWGYSDSGCNHLVDVHIGRLRSKLRSVPTRARYVVTVRGRGFRLMERAEDGDMPL
jgi:two-component system response regulator MtrA